MIVENPYTQPHYLTTYFPIKPTIIDKDRRMNGDYYRKPTQYWLVNCKPEQYMFFEPLEHVETHTIAHAEKLGIGKNRQVNRSMIHPQYARRFIQSYVFLPQPNQTANPSRGADGSLLHRELSENRESDGASV